MTATATAAPTPGMLRPQPTEYAAYYGKYIALVREDDIIQALQAQQKDMTSFLRTAPESQANVLHPPYTWTLKQVVNHINDGERIFAYRALRIARGDETPLPGFDENEYAKTSHVDRLTLGQLATEFETVRAATLSLLKSLTEESWSRSGTANNNPVSVRALAWIMAGHVQHHLAIMRERMAS
jgi:uncharacterized damage-inducible protein DinB